MKFKVLKAVALHKDLKEYREAVDSDLILYVTGEYEANDKYMERFSKVPYHIEVIKEVIEEPEQLPEIVEEPEQLPEVTEEKPKAKKSNKKK